MANRFAARMIAMVLATAAPPALAQAFTAIDVELRKAESATSQRGGSQAAQKIAAGFATLAGSRDNALRLVHGLREGRGVTLVGAAGEQTSFTPATGRMGWADVKLALVIAREMLARAAIHQPTHAQLDAALNGGAIPARGLGRTGTVTLRGVLPMRADGMSWSQVAQASGVRAGAAVNGLRELQRQVSTSADADAAAD